MAKKEQLKEAYTKTKELILNDEYINKTIDFAFYRGFILALFNFNLISIKEKTDLNTILNKKWK